MTKSEALQPQLSQVSRIPTPSSPVKAAASLLIAWLAEKGENAKAEFSTNLLTEYNEDNLEKLETNQ